jgi:hypothetical protein
MFNHRGNDGVATIRTDCLFDCDMRDSALVFAPKGTHGQIDLKFSEMFPARFVALCVDAEICRIATNLRCAEGQHVGGWRFFNVEHTARKSQVGEIHGKTDPIGGATPLADQCQVLRREGVVTHDRGRVGRRIEQRGA